MANDTGANAASEWREIDISSEAVRYYHYVYGLTESVFRIHKPIALFIRTDDHGDTHRITTESGIVYRPERGWIGISWEPKPDAPAFVV